MSSASPVKILTVGPPAGRIRDLFSKVAAIQSKHGPFSALFILGDLFKPLLPHPQDQQDLQSLSEEESQLLGGEIQVPLPTYFYQGTSKLHTDVLQSIRVSSSPNPLTSSDSFSHEIVPNLHFLGKSGVFETKEGLRVAFLGGKWDAAGWASCLETKGEPGPATRASEEEELSVPHITTHSVEKLLGHPSFQIPDLVVDSKGSAPPSKPGQPQTLAQARAQAAAEAAENSNEGTKAPPSILETRPPIDLLLTNYWPSGVSLFSNASLPDETARIWGCPPVATIAKAAMPRYHFSLAPGKEDPTPIVGLTDEVKEVGNFWEREPYVNEVQRQGRSFQTVTRFVSLARFGNPKKARWFLALNLVPASSTSSSQMVKPANSTMSPYFTPTLQGGETRKRGGASADAKGAQANEDMDLDSGPNFRWQGQPTKAKKRRTNGGDVSGSDGPPPEGYVCRICQSTEHYIRLCPQKSQPHPPPSSSTVAADRSIGSGSNATELRTKGEGETIGGGWKRSAGPETTTTLGITFEGLPNKPIMPKRPSKVPVGPEDCWFCLSNPKCSKHLIVAIGEECYIALPKGQLPPPGPLAEGEERLTNVPGGGHVLIVPMSHSGSIKSFEPELAGPIRSETEKYLEALGRTYSKFDSVAVSWELGKTSNTRVGHLQTQVIPLRKGMVSGLLERLRKGAEENGHPFEEDEGEIERYFQTKSGGGQGEGDYFLTNLDGKRMLIRLKGKRFNMQFARQTIADHLGIPERSDWKACARTEEEEKEETSAFRGILEGELDED
ncbi:hypothetical protein IE53DRAFT_389059 [Violaceomyces palustris]|uniref:Uncharacterized protein n=1 Tax=Violaceomyces palustris TaxID=1673888 RepID=A0ACD0NSK8_9BASI|nr:hypothetical protein IE53DRAFT_389059 [Violaceomyces palustris]